MDNKTLKKTGKPSGIKVLLLSLLVVIIAVGIAAWLIKTAPSPKVRARKEQASLVEVSLLRVSDEAVVIESSGEVIPARQVDLQAQVAGQVVKISPSFIPGGRISAGEEVVKIDPEDYELTVEQQRAEVTRTEQEYLIESGRQDIAKHEWSLLSDQSEATELDRDLALRQPQLKQAAADLASARASLRQAELDLTRTSVTAPFNSVVISKDVELGAQISSSTLIGSLAGTDEFWVLLTLPVSDLTWFSAGPGNEGSTVILRPTGQNKEDIHWEGTVIRKQADLDENGRLAQIIVSVPGPLDNPDQPLLLGMYVTAKIQGKSVPGVFSIPRSALRGSNEVWLVNSESRLEVHPIDVVWSGLDRVLVRDGLEGGESLVITDLAAPVEEMLLKVVSTGEEDR